LSLSGQTYRERAASKWKLPMVESELGFFEHVGFVLGVDTSFPNRLLGPTNKTTELEVRRSARLPSKLLLENYS
jgi:hypothetical protein